VGTRYPALPSAPVGDQWPTIDELVVGDEPEAWRGVGFAVDPDGVCRIGTVRVRLAGRGVGKGLRTWSLRDLPTEPSDPAVVSGITTSAGDEPPATPAEHPNGTVSIDHVVLMSPNGERTCAEVSAATGLDVLRTRDTDTYGAPMRQWFFRLGGVVLELVAPQEPSGDGPARYFGLALTVADLDTLPERFGQHLGRVKDAVQPGRRIATLRHKDLGLSIPIAFMSPEPQPASPR